MISVPSIYDQMRSAEAFPPIVYGILYNVNTDSIEFCELK